MGRRRHRLENGPPAAGRENWRAGRFQVTIAGAMEEANKNPRRYQWPWVVAAAVALGIGLAIIWMTIAVKTVERERDLNAPLPDSRPVR